MPPEPTSGEARQPRFPTEQPGPEPSGSEHLWTDLEAIMASGGD